MADASSRVGPEGAAARHTGVRKGNSGSGRSPGLSLALALALASTAASGTPAYERFSDRGDGISCSYYDVQLAIGWPAGRPTWIDSQGAAQGARPFASHTIERTDPSRVRRIDATALVRSAWTDGPGRDGFLLRVAAGDRIVFHAREAEDPALRPQLVLSWPNGRRVYVEAAADAVLACSTYKGVGEHPLLDPAPGKDLVVRFDLDRLQAGERPAPTAAELVLVRPAQARAVHAVIDLYALARPFGRRAAEAADGLARGYPADAGIANDADVIFFDDFEASSVDSRWTQGMRAPASMVAKDPAQGFEPLSGRALRVTIERNEQLGLDWRYRFRQHGSEPEEIYFRYYLRLAPSWLSAVDGGKLPGLAGTYGRAGWGGRRWDGNKGWSLRGLYGVNPPPGHAAHGRLLLGTYAYHFKSGTYGQGVPWADAGLAGLVEPDRWYCIEQHLRLNTPGREDGVLRVWVDGQLALELDSLRLRDRQDIRIEEVWMNFFHGGTRPAPKDMHAYVDNLVIARRYIGPRAP